MILKNSWKELEKLKTSLKKSKEKKIEFEFLTFSLTKKSQFRNGSSDFKVRSFTRFFIQSWFYERYQ
jgi:hypothetical protein